jgi:hypothetical protein
MKKRDGRALDHNALEAIRIQAVQRVEAGESPEEVIRVLGFARTVFEFVRQTKGKLRLFFLPPYSPELNLPDELVWNHLKNHGVGKRIVRSREELKRVVIGYLRFLQKTPDFVQAFFRERCVRYVLA